MISNLIITTHWVIITKSREGRLEMKSIHWDRLIQALIYFQNYCIVLVVCNCLEMGDSREYHYFLSNYGSISLNLYYHPVIANQISPIHAYQNQMLQLFIPGCYLAQNSLIKTESLYAWKHSRDLVRKNCLGGSYEDHIAINTH